METKERICADIQIDHEGEIPWGPPLFSLWIKGCKLEKRSFFKDFCISSDKNIIAISEYMYIDRATYFTQIFVFNIQKGQATHFKRIENNIVRPISFEGQQLIYSYAKLPGLIQEAEINFNDLTGWIDL